jgi:IMP dehydrogenase
MATNGDVTSNGSHSASNGVSSKLLDPARALDALKEYQSGDGLVVQELMDSKSNGGLTYNDFLVMPGYIGMMALDVSTAQASS